MVQDPGRKGGIDILGKKFNHDLKKKNYTCADLWGAMDVVEKKKKTFRVRLEGG